MNKIQQNINSQPQLSVNDQLNNNSHGNQQSSSESISSNKRPIIVRATHEYVPVNNDELHIHVNDLITITNLEEGGWWEGTLDTRTGWFPSNYVVVMEPSQDDGCDSGVVERLVAMPVVGSNGSEQSDEYKRMIVAELIESEVKFVAEMEAFGERVLSGLPYFGATQPEPPPPILATLKQAYAAIIQAHKTALLTPLQTHTASLASQSFENLRVGRIFMTAAPQLESAHTRYCSYHPRFVQFVEGNREVFEMRCDGDEEMNPVLRVIMCLSAPFRRVERYGNVLSELDCHVEGFHGDKGELRRGVMYYRGLEKTLTSLRKQKEMELEVLTPGQIKEFEGPEISTLGEIIIMGLMYVVGAQGERLPRYFVLFPSTILILAYDAYDTGDSSFTYKGRVSVGGVTVVNGRGGGEEEHGFEIAGPTLHPIVIQCPTAAVKQVWLQSLNDVIRATRCYSSPFGQQPSSNVQQPNAHHHHNQTQVIPPQTPLINNPLTPPVLQAWNITRLRPSPPYNPFLAEYSRGSSSSPLQLGKLDRGGFGRSSSGGSTARSGSGFGKTGSFTGFGSGGWGGGIAGVSNEEDFAVLSIVDGFCVRGSSGVLLRNDPSNRSLRSLQEYNSQRAAARPPPTFVPPLQPNKPLPQLVKLLHDDVTALHERIGSLTRQLEEERLSRGQLVGLLVRVVESQQQQQG